MVFIELQQTQEQMQKAHCINTTRTLIWTSCASPNSIPENSLEQPGYACKKKTIQIQR